MISQGFLFSDVCRWSAQGQHDVRQRLLPPPLHPHHPHGPHHPHHGATQLHDSSSSIQPTLISSAHPRQVLVLHISGSLFGNTRTHKQETRQQGKDARTRTSKVRQGPQKQEPLHCGKDVQDKAFKCKGSIFRIWPTRSDAS